MILCALVRACVCRARAVGDERTVVSRAAALPQAAPGLAEVREQLGFAHLARQVSVRAIAAGWAGPGWAGLGWAGLGIDTLQTGQAAIRLLLLLLLLLLLPEYEMLRQHLSYHCMADRWIFAYITYYIVYWLCCSQCSHQP